MYKITTPEGKIYNLENPNFIYIHKNGCFLITHDRKKAEGVAINSTPYLFKDGTILCEVDGGNYIDELIAENKTLADQLAEADEAIIEIYETMEGFING